MDNTTKSRRGLRYTAGEIYGIVMLTGKSFMGVWGKRQVEFICNCGRIGWTSLSRLKVGSTKSCGCLSTASLNEGRTTHGLCRHKLYKLWSDMIQRCTNPKNDNYHNYGGRGIDVCKEWRENAGVFIVWAENNGWEYGVGLTLERKENDKGYNPNNCTWVTRKVQSRNRRNNVLLTLFGETKCVFDWSMDKRCSVAYNTISNRIFKLGWEVEKAILTHPLR